MDNATRLELLKIQKSNIENIIQLDKILYNEVLSYYEIILNIINKEINELNAIMKGE